jgi:hypothetical protein
MEFLGRLHCVDTWGTNHLVTRSHVPEEGITLTNTFCVVFTKYMGLRAFNVKNVDICVEVLF